MEFRWNDWNIEHIARHGVDPQEAEAVVLNARRPFPERRDGGKLVVWGQGHGGRYLQVIFVLDPDKKAFVIHARPLTDAEKHRLRRRQRP